MKYVLLLLATLIPTQAIAQDWTPPTDPDVSKILDEAEKDAAEGRNEIALQKHLWYHENALKYQPSQYGVRLSYALSSWVKLGANYRPAMKKLREVRNESAKALVAKQPIKTSYRLFHDVASIDEYLGQTDKTVELFVKLDSEHKPLAKMVYDLAQSALLKEKKYELCGQYVNAKEEIKSIVSLYDQHLRMAATPRFGDDMKQYAEISLTQDSATLVAILAINKKNEEAEKVAKTAKAAWDNDKFHTVLDEALKEKFPVEAQLTEE